MQHDPSVISHIEILVFGKQGSGKSVFYRWLVDELSKHGLSVTSLDMENKFIRITKDKLHPTMDDKLQLRLWPE